MNNLQDVIHEWRKAKSSTMADREAFFEAFGKLWNSDKLPLCDKAYVIEALNQRGYTSFSDGELTEA